MAFGGLPFPECDVRDRGPWLLTTFVSGDLGIPLGDTGQVQEKVCSWRCWPQDIGFDKYFSERGTLRTYVAQTVVRQVPTRGEEE